MESTPGTRLKEAMMKKGFATAADLARRMGYKEVTVRAHINGNSGLQAKKAAAYSKVLGVSPEWLLYGKEDPLDLPADDKDAALAIVEFAQQNSEKRLSPREKLDLVAEMAALVAKVRGR